MNNALKMGGLAVAACAACCAVSIVPAVVAGTSIAAVGAATLWTWTPAVALLAVPIGTLYFLWRRKPRVADRGSLGLQQADACSCGGACGSGDSQTDATALPVACSLDARGLKQRVTWIENLSARALRRAERLDLVLDLTYAPEALDDVREPMRREQSCCGFLDFTLRHDDTDVYLRVASPESARLAANELFAQFTPASAAPRVLETTS